MNRDSLVVAIKREHLKKRKSETNRGGNVGGQDKWDPQGDM